MATVASMDVRTSLIGEVERIEAALQRVRVWVANLQRSGNLKGVDIITMVAFEWDMSPEELKTRSNSRYYTEPRQVACYLLQQTMHFSMSQIGRDMGGFNHTSVLNGIRTIKRRMDADPLLMERVESVKRRLR